MKQIAMRESENISPKCEGVCEAHSGELYLVEVDEFWGEFTYCEEAIAEDRRRGFPVKILRRMNDL